MNWGVGHPVNLPKMGIAVDKPLARMREAVKKNGFEAVGPLWQRSAEATGTFYRREFLLRLKDED